MRVSLPPSPPAPVCLGPELEGESIWVTTPTLDNQAVGLGSFLIRFSHSFLVGSG